MPWDSSSGDARRADRGSALVIVLFFVILLTGLTIAFLARSLTASKVSNSSANETKVNLLANSAGDIIIGDLKQEIVAGSTLSGTVNWPVYAPNNNATMIPFQNGVPITGTLIPNLISRSVRPGNTAGASPYVAYSANYTAASVPPNRAADNTATPAAVSTTTPSLNGRFISKAQWNSHYLIPRDPGTDAAGSLSADTTPVSTFVPPDWVVVTRSGASAVTWNANLNDTGATTGLANTGYAVGRYAYAVYNEGGLLDMNVAGFPSDTTAGGPNGLSTAQASGKGSLALADLTQLVAGAALSQAKINNLVGWRNYATAQLSSANGTYGGFTFTPPAPSNWLTNFVLTNTNGFMKTIAPTGVTTPPSDQAFVSRQQLIALTQSLGISPDFLQYMGTFSRSFEQPSFTPDPNRPMIINNATTSSTPPTVGGSPNEDTYIGNNDGQGGDSSINPPFLAKRVSTGTFTRFDGSSTVLNEPLVKKKFPLSRLAYVAYNATNATVKLNAAITTAANPDPIFDWFGLKRTSASSPWVYNHGATKILTLTQVATAKREPDFAELLKAAIVAGSLAKAGPNLNIGGNNLQYTFDTTLDLQVLQIMANLIDQQDADSYPTVIQIQAGTFAAAPVTANSGLPYYYTVYGVEDLPYFYRYHLLSVVHTLPNPVFPASLAANSLSFTVPSLISTKTSITSAVNYQLTTGATSAASWTWGVMPYPATIKGIQKTSLVSGGEADLLYIPDLWNPHDADTTATSASNRPAKFELFAVTDDPYTTTNANLLGPVSPVWNVGAETQLTGSGDVAPNPLAVPPVVPQSSFQNILKENDGTPKLYYWPISAPKPLTQANTLMTFSDNGGKLFREPTLLWNNNPTGLSLTGSSVTDANTGRTYYGIIAGKSPVSMQAVFASSKSTAPFTSSPQPYDGTYVIQGNTLTTLSYTPASSYPQITFALAYQDPNNSSNYIVYDVKYPDLHGLTALPVVADKTVDYTNYQNLLSTGQFGNSNASGFDPRSSRWGVGTASNFGEISAGTAGGATTTGNNFLLEPTASTQYSASSLNAFSVTETDRARSDKGDQVNYSNPGMTSNPGKNVQMRWFTGAGYSASNGDAGDVLQFNGLFTQNIPNITTPSIIFNSKGSPTIAQTAGQGLYNEDPDGVARPAMGAYASTTLTDASTSSQYTASTTRLGLPMATADTLSDTAVATPTVQSQSRPLILNRAFRSVSEMSYAFRGTPWKNIDFFTPESGDAALLDTFCVNELPTNGIVAGKVDLNTRQTPVLKALIAGASRDEFNNVATPPSYALAPVTSTEAQNIASTLTGLTADTTHAWRGPLQNISALVGRYVATPGTTTGYSDFYTYTPPANAIATEKSTAIVYSGLSAALDCTAINGTANHVYADTSSPVIQRFRESGLRPLVDGGQVRVWNLLIDLVVQTGRYPKTSTDLSQFLVDGQKRVWLHVAIDRMTGQVLDKQVEVVSP
jgi:hypothetical protein